MTKDPANQLHTLSKPAPPKGLTAPALIAAFLAAAALPLATATWVGTSSGHLPTELASALGILAASLIFLQFVSSGRFETLSGKVGLDRTMGFHRIAAYAVVCFALAHPFLYAAHHIPSRPIAAVTQMEAMFYSPRLRTGVVALALLIVIVTFASFRTRPFVRYEIWRAAHGPVALVIAGLTLHHLINVGAYSSDPTLLAVWSIYAAFAFASALIVYALRPWRMWREPWRVETAAPAAQDVTEVVLLGPQQTAFRKLRGGQFIWLTFAPHHPPFHDHPFSIASSAGFLPRLRLIIRRAGDCTETFQNLKPGTPVAVDGPHGSFVLPEEASAVAMVAGGVGIAPLLGMLEEAADLKDTRPFHLLYAVRSEAAIAGRKQLADLKARLDLNVTYCIEQSCATLSALDGPLCQNHLKVLTDGLDISTSAFLICGPPPMMELAADSFIKLGAMPNQIHYERFDYGAGHGLIDRHRRRAVLASLATLLVLATAFAIR